MVDADADPFEGVRVESEEGGRRVDAVGGIAKLLKDDQAAAGSGRSTTSPHLGSMRLSLDVLPESAGSSLRMDALVSLPHAAAALLANNLSVNSSALLPSVVSSQMAS
jgi:hypothetical protein